MEKAKNQQKPYEVWLRISVLKILLISFFQAVLFGFFSTIFEDFEIEVFATRAVVFFVLILIFSLGMREFSKRKVAKK